MTKQDKEQAFDLIAEFMGYKIVETGGAKFYEKEGVMHAVVFWDKDWDWILQVWKKAHDIAIESVEWHDITFRMCFAVINAVKIEMAFEVVIDAIKYVKKLKTK